jgi:hypothetical protein
MYDPIFIDLVERIDEELVSIVKYYIFPWYDLDIKNDLDIKIEETWKRYVCLIVYSLLALKDLFKY